MFPLRSQPRHCLCLAARRHWLLRWPIKPLAKRGREGGNPDNRLPLRTPTTRPALCFVYAGMLRTYCPAGPQINIHARLVFCVRWYANFEFRGRAGKSAYLEMIFNTSTGLFKSTGSGLHDWELVNGNFYPIRCTCPASSFLEVVQDMVVVPLCRSKTWL